MDLYCWEIVLSKLDQTGTGIEAICKLFNVENKLRFAVTRITIDYQLCEHDNTILKNIEGCENLEHIGLLFCHEDLSDYTKHFTKLKSIYLLKSNILNLYKLNGLKSIILEDCCYPELSIENKKCLKHLTMMYVEGLHNLVGYCNLTRLDIMSDIDLDLSRMPKIKDLSVTRCGNISGLNTLRDLRKLRISNNNMISEIVNLSKLKSIDLFNCISLRKIGNCQILKEIKLAYCKSCMIDNLPNLEKMTIESCYDTIRINNCQKLSYICFDWYGETDVQTDVKIKFRKYIHLSLAKIENLSDVEVLKCEYCYHLKSIENCPNLRKLICDKLVEIKDCPNLNDINITK